MLINAIESTDTHAILNRLDISSSKVGDKGFLRLLECYESMPELQHVKSTDNYVSDKYEKLITELLHKNTTLITLNLVGNRLSLSCMKLIKKIMDRNNK